MHKYLRTGLFIALLAGFATVSANPGYKSITPPVATANADKIEVVEVFWYGCPHCYDFEPYVDAWVETAADDVDFKRMPAMFRQNWLPHARGFYAAEKLGVLDELHGAIFHAMHEEGLHLGDERMMRQLFEKHGVERDAFNEAYHSKAVEDKIKESLAMTRRYQVTGTPSVIINGKYVTSGPLAGSFERMIEVVDELVARERAALEQSVRDSARGEAQPTAAN